MPSDEDSPVPPLAARDGQAALFVTPDATPAPDHLGHRKRLRERFLQGGPDALPDYELVELLLFGGVPRVDTKPIARALLARFGSFEDMLAAPPDELRRVKGMTDGAVVILKAVDAAAVRLARKRIPSDKPVLSSWSAVLDYCAAAMARSSVEQFRIIFLDRKNRLIADEVVSRGTVDHAPVYPRQIAKRVLELDASAVILVHNHPSGDPTPSRADIDMTKSIADLLGKMDVRVHDHLVIGKAGHASFRGLGLL